MAVSGKKRKSKDGLQGTHSSKRLRLADDLPWRRAAEPVTADFDEDGIVFELEEIEGVAVEYVESKETGKKIAKFTMIEGDGSDSERTNAGQVLSEEEWIPAESDDDDNSRRDFPTQNALPVPKPDGISIGVFDDSPIDDKLPQILERLPLHNVLKWALHRSGFAQPTPIQSQTWKAVLTPSRKVMLRDVVGVAETGSGKTLAYGLPIVQHAITKHLAREMDNRAETGNGEEKSLSGLVLCPTRELALQVCRHLSDLIQQSLVPVVDVQAPSTPPKDVKKGKNKKKTKVSANYQHPPVTVVALTGGVSIYKQKRQLEGAKSGRPDIIVATPGRLWELLSENAADLALQIKAMPFLVLDEADRMVEAGHFAELDKLFALTNRAKDDTSAYVNDFEDETLNPLKSGSNNAEMRTYVFSATMSKDLQNNLKLPLYKRRKSRSDSTKGSLGALGDLVDKLDFRDESPLILNLLPEGGTAIKLKECHLECMASDKDALLYYFLMRYPGKTLVFLSSIDGIRRLYPILSLLQIGTTTHIHSQMEQKARLRAIERFHAAQGTSLLLATDVAARGLDIRDIDHVVHYQLPRTADAYVHRSGRTARAGKEGVSLALVAPEEKSLAKTIMHALSKDTNSLIDIPIEWSVVEQLRKRIDLAKKIDKAQHQATKAKHDTDWIQKTADALELDLDNLASDDERRITDKAKSTAKVASLKAELAQDLRKPLRIAGISSRYITSGKASELVKDMINGRDHNSIIGLRNTTAISEGKRSGASNR